MDGNQQTSQKEQSNRPQQLLYLVGNLQRIVIGRQSNVRLLLTVGADQCVDLGHLNIVKGLDSSLDLEEQTKTVKH